MACAQRRVGWIASAVLAFAQGAGAADPASVRRCVEENAPRSSLVQTVSVERGEAAGATRAKLIWRRFRDGHRVLVRMLAPDELAGAALLALSEDAGRPAVYVYLPALDDTRRVYSADGIRPLFGEELPVEELRQLAMLPDRSRLRLLEDAQLGARPVWVLEAIPDADAGSPYRRLVAWVDREYCLVLRLDFFEADARVRRRIQVDPNRVVRAGGSWLPTRLVVEDLVAPSRATLTIEKIEVDVPIAPALLSVKALSGPSPR